MTEQKKRLLKAKIAVALQNELGRVPKEAEIDNVFLPLTLNASTGDFANAGDGYLPPLIRLQNNFLFNPHVVRLMTHERNLLYVAADADLLESNLEKYVPAVVFDRLQAQLDRADLIKILYWIALHPFDGDDSAAADVGVLGLRQPAASAEDIRARAAVYGVKLLGRLAGRTSDAR